MNKSFFFVGLGMLIFPFLIGFFIWAYSQGFDLLRMFVDSVLVVGVIFAVLAYFGCAIWLLVKGVKNE